MKPNVIKATLPVLVAGAIFIAITTIGKDAKGSNFIQDMIQTIKNRGRHLINFVEISLVCNDCKRAGKGASCQHKMGEIPHWQLNDRYDDVKILMGEDDNTFSTELKGFKEDNSVRNVYDRDVLERMRSIENIFTEVRPTPVEYIYTSFDPNAGSEKSGVAIISCIYPQYLSKCVIIGAEFQKCEDLDEMEGLMSRHIQMIQSIPEFASAQVVFIPESNLGFEATHMSNFMSNILGTRLVCMKEDKEREGNRTSNHLKHLFAETLKLHLRSNRVIYHPKFFTTSKGYDANSMKNEIYTQLANFCVIIRKHENDIYLEPKIIYSGKSGYGYDDLVIALQMNISLSIYFRMAPKYQRFFIAT